jgi:membrane protein implicated in regulation of membrane protease activity
MMWFLVGFLVYMGLFFVLPIVFVVVLELFRYAQMLAVALGVDVNILLIGSVLAVVFVGFLWRKRNKARRIRQIYRNVERKTQEDTKRYYNNVNSVLRR